MVKNIVLLMSENASQLSQHWYNCRCIDIIMFICLFLLFSLKRMKLRRKVKSHKFGHGNQKLD